MHSFIPTRLPKDGAVPRALAGSPTVHVFPTERTCVTPGGWALIVLSRTVPRALDAELATPSLRRRVVRVASDTAGPIVPWRLSISAVEVRLRRASLCL